MCAIPLGGYVKMLDEREGPVAAPELHRAFTQQSLGRRSLIVLAGPVANLLLAIVLYWGLFMHGVDELRPVLGAPKVASAAAQAGVRAGDLVLSINGEEVRSWEDLRWRILQDLADSRESQLHIKRKDGNQEILSLATQQLGIDTLDKDPIRLLGLTIEPPTLPPVIGRILPDMPAARAGLREGDRILAIDGEPVSLWSEVARSARAAPGRKLLLDIDRAGQRLEVSVVPDLVEDKENPDEPPIGRIGFFSEGRSVLA